MKKTKQDGFGVVEALLILIVLLLIGFIGYYVYHTHQTTKASSATNTTYSAPKQTATTKYMAVPEWGVKLPLGNDIQGTTYKFNSDSTPQSIDLSVPNSECTPMATVFRKTTSDKDPSLKTMHVGNFYYSLISGQGSLCFKGDRVTPESSYGAKTWAVYKELSIAFDNMTVTSSN